MQLVPLNFKQVLYEAGAPIDHAYFPICGVASALVVMENGGAIEVGTIGNEGVVGLPAFLRSETSLMQVIVQVPGDALRMKADALKQEGGREGLFRELLIAYQSALLAQISRSVACNGLHSVRQRCCRWLLMTHDRVAGDEFPLTHELLAVMLGVRRASISDVLRPFREGGLIRCHRGKIAILDQPGLKAACCECYQSVNDEFARLLG